MAVRSISLGKVSIDAKAKTSGVAANTTLEDARGGLYPIRMAAYRVDEYRMANGWPVSIPDYDIRSRTLVSSEGYVLADRVPARDIDTAAMVRWIADEDTFDLTALRWIPWYSEASMKFTFGTETAPTYISDYEYQVNKEVFYEGIINFDADSAEHMALDMSSSIGGAIGYTMLMAVSMNSVYGNTLDRPFSGIWGPGSSLSPALGWVNLTLQGDTLYLESDQTPPQKLLRINHLLSSAAPMLMALVVGRPVTRIYVAAGPNSMYTGAVNIGSKTIPLDGHIYLGRTRSDLLHTADMSIAELNLYGEQLSAEQVRSEFATLSAVYGGDK